MAPVQKVMVVGATGMLGQGVCSVLSQYPNLVRVQAVTRDNFDVIKDMEDAPCPRGYDYVINCVGAIPQRRDPGYTEEEMWELNCAFPKSLALRCQSRGTKLIHITTDCGYSGGKPIEEGGYTEDDVPDPVDTYGKSKVGCEKFLVDTGAAMVIRTSIVGENTHRTTGLYEWFRRELDGGAWKVTGYTNHWWNGVTTKTFGEVCLKVILSPEEDPLWTPELVHLFSPSSVSKYDLLKMFAVHLGYDPDQVVEPTETPIPVNRTLSTTKLFCSRMRLKDLKEQICGIE